MRELRTLGEAAADRAQGQHVVAPPSASGALAAGADLPAVLGRAISLVHALGEDFAGDDQHLGELKNRLAQGRFHLAVLGQFKRGKSTLLNALLGEEVLPTSVIPLTAIPTFIRPGQELQARVLFQDDRDAEEFIAGNAGQLNEFIARFVTESGNPKNRLGVLQVEVTHPAGILHKGVVLIDTPGIGSTFRHNTEATLNFLPQCDAALFLVSADPPITEVEVEFLKQVRSKVARLFFILNKVDYLSDEERRAALEFLRKVLAEQVGVPAETPIFCVSARQASEARDKGDQTLWAASGLEKVERHLVEFLACEKATALREAVGRKAADVVADVLMRLRLAMRSLQMPLEELRHRLEVFERKLQEVCQQRLAAGDLLAGDCRRMHTFLEEHAEELRAKARQYLSGIVREAMAGNGQSDEQAIQNALAEAIPGYFEHQTGQTTELFRKRMAETLRPHQGRADELIESVRRTAAELFDVPYHAPESADAFEMVQQPYWVTHKWSSTLSPIPVGLMDRLLPASVRQGRLHKRLLDQVAGLVVSNVESLRWATYQSIDQTFTRFGSALDDRLADTTAATHGAIRAAMDRRQQQSEAVSQEVSRLETAVDELAQVQAALVKG
jgi:ribosome biogenesis GTPase A/DNA-binding transcriptional MerR regulator